MRKFAIVMVFCVYWLMYLALLLGKYSLLFIAPIVVVGWAIFLIVLLAKDWKPMWKEIRDHSEKPFEIEPQEPRDFMWIIHTCAFVLWILFWIGSITIDVILR